MLEDLLVLRGRIVNGDPDEELLELLDDIIAGCRLFIKDIETMQDALKE